MHSIIVRTLIEVQSSVYRVSHRTSIEHPSKFVRTSNRASIDVRSDVYRASSIGIRWTICRKSIGCRSDIYRASLGHPSNISRTYLSKINRTSIAHLSNIDCISVWFGFRRAAIAAYPFLLNQQCLGAMTHNLCFGVGIAVASCFCGEHVHVRPPGIEPGAV